MAGLFLVRSADSGFANHALDEARAQFALHGFADGTALDFPGWHLLHFPYISGGPAMFHAAGEDFAAVAGTFTFDGLMGRPALERLLESPGAMPDWSRLGGQFVALVRRRGRTFLYTDYFAAFRLFHDGEDRIFSTSFLAAAKALPRLSFDAQGVYELVFNVMPIDDDTLFEQLKTLNPRIVIELTPEGVVRHDDPKPLPGAAEAMPMDERIARHAGRLSSVARTFADQFGDHAYCPLSGGIDSRLALAVLRSAGATPNVYVYGGEERADVGLARAIGAAEGFHVEWIDKSRPLPDPDDFAERVRRNFHRCDALPPFGNIFDYGGDAEARELRHADGALSVSGGCGEIYRNFFFLPDRALDADAIASGFFARFAPGDATALFEPRAFLRRIRTKVLDALELPQQGRVPRAMLEQVYPRIRCRALFGAEISLEARHGAYMMPFLDQHVVAEAMRLPMSLKNVGVFEARLLDAIDPALARHMSTYGHDFTGPPNLRHRHREWCTRIRPTWLRRHSYAIQRRLGEQGDEHGALPGHEHLSRLIDLDFPAMRKFFHVEQVRDAGPWRRIASLEYLAQHLGSRLSA